MCLFLMLNCSSSSKLRDQILGSDSLQKPANHEYQHSLFTSRYLKPFSPQRQIYSADQRVCVATFYHPKKSQLEGLEVSSQTASCTDIIFGGPQGLPHCVPLPWPCLVGEVTMLTRNGTPQYSLLSDGADTPIMNSALRKWLAPVALLLSALFCQNAGLYSATCVYLGWDSRLID